MTLVAVLLCAQVAEAHHQADHLFGHESDSTLCDSTHTPVTALSNSPGFDFSGVATGLVISGYLTPEASQLVAGRHPIRAPPVITIQY